MNLVSEALRQNRLAQAAELLERHKPKPGRADLRGWEWRHLWLQTQSDEWVTLGQHQNTVTGLNFSRDGHWLASAGWDNKVKIWDPVRCTQVAELPHPDNRVYCAVFSPDGKFLVSGARNALRIWRTGSWLLAREVSVEFAAFSVRISPDSKLAAVCGVNKVQIWEMETGREMAGFQRHHTGAEWDQLLAYAPDGLTLAVADGDGVTLWALENRTQVAHFGIGDPENHVTSAGFSPDGRFVFSGHLNGAIKIWDIQSRVAAMTLSWPNRVVLAAAFSSKGDLMVLGGDDLRVLNTDTWREAATLRGHQAQIRSVAFAPDGDLLASGDDDGYLKLWKYQDLARRNDDRIGYPSDLY
jgi:WD40 repeat protein